MNLIIICDNLSRMYTFFFRYIINKQQLEFVLGEQNYQSIDFLPVSSQNLLFKHVCISLRTKNILYTHARCTVKNVRKLLRRRTVYLHVFKTYGYIHELFLFPYVYRSLGWCVWCRAYQRNISPVLKKCRRICVWSILYRPHTIEYYFTSPSLGPGNTKQNEKK